MVKKERCLTPRNGHTLVVGIVARISGCANQKEVSLNDQVDHAKEEVTHLYDGPVDYRIISTRGKGERLDRPELADVERLLRSRELDLLVMEDLGRLVRGTEAVALCGIAVDHGTRAIAPNDCIDTADDTWEEDVISACRDHVGHNAHTSKRLKHKLMNRFRKFGGATPTECYGYIKPPDAKTYYDWQKNPAAEPILKEARERLIASGNCTAVADWLNKTQVPVGKYCRRKTWSGAMVRRLFCNPIMKGTPARGAKKTVKHHETGRRIAVPNPDGPSFIDCPHLAFFSAEEFDEVVALLVERNAKYRRKPQNGMDSRYRVPRTRTRFPGQHARCWYCGSILVWGANGMRDHLMCSGARDWHCWNSIGLPGPLFSARVVEAITSELAALPGFADQFAEMVNASYANEKSHGERLEELQRKQAALATEQERFLAAIAQFGPSTMFDDKFRELAQREQSLRAEKGKLEQAIQACPSPPRDIHALHEILQEEFRSALQDDDELAPWLQRIVPEIHMYLVRSVDGGHLLPRARVILELGAGTESLDGHAGVHQLLRRELTLDGFEPAQRISILPAAEKLSLQGYTHRQIAERIEGHPTSTAVGNALRLLHEMREQGLDNPYQFVAAPPDDYNKLRRHRNPKFRFQACPGYVPPPL